LATAEHYGITICVSIADVLSRAIFQGISRKIEERDLAGAGPLVCVPFVRGAGK
jgi:hypothetical protein